MLCFVTKKSINPYVLGFSALFLPIDLPVCDQDISIPGEKGKDQWCVSFLSTRVCFSACFFFSPIYLPVCGQDIPIPGGLKGKVLEDQWCVSCLPVRVLGSSACFFSLL